MTTEQLTAIGDALRSQPANWSQLPADMQAAMTEYFRPLPFPADRREWLSKWVLGPVSDSQKAEIETLYGNRKPLTNWEGRRDADGNRWYGADLLTDALDNRRLAVLLPVLETLTLRYAEEIAWPEVEAAE